MTEPDENETLLTNLRGKWAQGIEPRGLTWIIKDKLAICERIGGYGAGHRPVRRQEEIVWILNSNFSYVVSLIEGTDNLRNYEELRLPYLHRPISRDDDFSRTLPKIYHEFEQRLDYGERLLVHRSEMNDFLSGFVGGYLAWTRLVPDLPGITSVTEQLLQRQLGPLARRMVHEVYQARSDYYEANPDGPPRAGSGGDATITELDGIDESAVDA